MAETVVQTSDLTRHYGATVGVEALDLGVERGEVLGILGPNGAGKTTTMRLLLDLIRPTRGSAMLFGRPTLAAARSCASGCACARETSRARYATSRAAPSRRSA